MFFVLEWGESVESSQMEHPVLIHVAVVVPRVVLVGIRLHINLCVCDLLNCSDGGGGGGACDCCGLRGCG